jgi:hypothetical protein
LVEGLIKWHFGETAAWRVDMDEAISVAKEQNDMHGLVMALFFVTMLDHFERRTAEVERLATELMEVATRQHFAFWLAIGKTFRGWARSASGEAVEGLAWIEDGIRALRATAFREAIATAQQQKSISLEKRAEATYAEYRRQKANLSGGHGVRLPL